MSQQNQQPNESRAYMLPSLSVLVIVSLLAIYLFAWNPQTETTQHRERPPVPVRIQVVSEEIFVDSIEALGTTFAREAVNITAKKSGIVSKVHFEDGAQVTTGDILVTLHNDEEKAKVLEEQIVLAENRRQLERLLNLKKRQAAARSAIEEQSSSVKESEARLIVAKAQLNELIIRAPFDGVLGTRNVSPGSLISPGTLIATLDDLTVIKVDFSVPETFLSTVSTGQVILAESSAWPAKPFQGEVTNISSRIDPVTRAINIRAEIDNSDEKLRPG
ncbi:MAG: efflux transporter periplasmic adaptor subunit, partial [Gammaproteobacteria bacterium]